MLWRVSDGLETHISHGRYYHTALLRSTMRLHTHTKHYAGTMKPLGIILLTPMWSSFSPSEDTT